MTATPTPTPAAAADNAALIARLAAAALAGTRRLSEVIASTQASA